MLTVTTDTPKELVTLRKALFANAALVHHYSARRAIADAVPEASLRLTPIEASALQVANWRALIEA